MNMIFSLLKKLIRGYFISTGLLFLFLVLTAIFLQNKNKKPQSEPLQDSDRKVLDFDLSGSITETEISHPFALLTQQYSGGSGSVYLPSLRKILLRAKQDQRITGLYLKVGELQGSYASFEELRNILEEFATSKKPIHVWFSSADTKSYFLSTVATRIGIAPLGGLQITGPVFQLTYLGTALKKLGISFDVIKHGRYKSVFEPYFIAGDACLRN